VAFGELNRELRLAGSRRSDDHPEFLQLAQRRPTLRSSSTQLVNVTTGRP
jgi:hypothetical protein